LTQSVLFIIYGFLSYLLSDDEANEGTTVSLESVQKKKKKPSTETSN